MNSSHRSLHHQNGSSLTAPANTSSTMMPSIHNSTFGGVPASSSNGGGSSSSLAKMTSLEHLMHRLVAKVVSQNVSPDVSEKKKLEFVAKSYNYLSKVLASDSFAPSYDSFELAEKTKKKRTIFKMSLF